MHGERCDFCETGRLRRRRVREYYRVGRDLLVIDDVPSFVCHRCGERYFDALVARQMRALARRRATFREKASFSRVGFRTVGASA